MKNSLVLIISTSNVEKGFCYMEERSMVRMHIDAMMHSGMMMGPSTGMMERYSSDYSILSFFSSYLQLPQPFLISFVCWQHP